MKITKTELSILKDFILFKDEEGKTTQDFILHLHDDMKDSPEDYSYNEYDFMNFLFTHNDLLKKDNKEIIILLLKDKFYDLLMNDGGDDDFAHLNINDACELFLNEVINEPSVLLTYDDELSFYLLIKEKILSDKG